MDNLNEVPALIDETVSFNISDTNRNDLTCFVDANICRVSVTTFPSI